MGRCDRRMTRRALRYGRHLDDCARVRLVSEQCTCGLDRALALARFDNEALASK